MNKKFNNFFGWVPCQASEYSSHKFIIKVYPGTWLDGDDSPPSTLKMVPEKKCDCGSGGNDTTHYHWCSLNNK